MPRPPRGARARVRRGSASSAAPPTTTRTTIAARLRDEHRTSATSPAASSWSRPCPRTCELKIDALARRRGGAAAGAALASNTSSISIDDLAALLERPDALPRPALLQPGAGVDARRDRARRRHRRRARRRGRASGSHAIGKTADRRERRPGLRLLAARRRARARGDPHARGGRRLAPRTSTPPWRSATSIRSGPLRTTDIVGLDVRLGIAEYLHVDARRAVRAARPAAAHGRRGHARPQDRRGLLPVGCP